MFRVGAWIAALWGIALAFGLQAEPQGVIVCDLVESPRLLSPGIDGEQLLFSPRGTRYLLISVRGDVARNGNWLEFISGPVESTASATPRKHLLFTQDYQSLALRNQPPVWLSDERTIVFIWCDGLKPSAVLSLDLETGAVRDLARASTDITAFDITPDGRAIAYVARKPAGNDAERFEKMRREGFAVPEEVVIASTLLRGVPEDGALDWAREQELYIQKSGEPRALRASVQLRAFAYYKPRISPDGRWVAMGAPPDPRHSSWAAYTGQFIEGYRKRPYDGRGSGIYFGYIGQIWLVDSGTGSAAPLWDAPAMLGVPISWQSSGSAIVVGPTYWPSSDEGLSGRAYVRKDLTTGASEILPQTIVTEMQSSKATTANIRLRQGLEAYPSLSTVSRHGRQFKLLDDILGIAGRFKLGKVENAHWKDASGRLWSGRLHYPLGYNSRARYPLAILTMVNQAWNKDQFSLSGNANALPGPAIAQPLAARGIFALAMMHPDDPSALTVGEPTEAPTVLEGYESAIQYLAAGQLIDPEKVGLAGFSRTGYYVGYAISHSNLKFAAATTSDNADYNYGQYLMVGTANGRAEYERTNGGKPYGSEISNWLRRTSAFNVDRIRTPLRLEVATGGVPEGLLNNWELFTLLRELKRPVELFFLPDSEHGAHPPELPQQQLATLEGTLDWHDFWLTGHEDSNPEKADQYARWRQLAAP
jgi:dipeptidyl aminopeptidase/acylaminoacyl peptidase